MMMMGMVFEMEGRGVQMDDVVVGFVIKNGFVFGWTKRGKDLLMMASNDICRIAYSI